MIRLSRASILLCDLGSKGSLARWQRLLKSADVSNAAALLSISFSDVTRMDAFLTFCACFYFCSLPIRFLQFVFGEENLVFRPSRCLPRLERNLCFRSTPLRSGFITQHCEKSSFFVCIFQVGAAYIQAGFLAAFSYRSVYAILIALAHLPEYFPAG